MHISGPKHSKDQFNAMGIWDWFEQNTTVFIETCAVLVDLQHQQITHKQCNKELRAKINFYYLIETHGSPCWGLLRNFIFVLQPCLSTWKYWQHSISTWNYNCNHHKYTCNAIRIFIMIIIINNIIIIIIITIMLSLRPRPVFAPLVLSSPASAWVACVWTPSLFAW